MEEPEPEYVGVHCLPEQLAWRAQLDGYEDFFGDAESAALVRELVILVRRSAAPRNFEELTTLKSLCQELHRRLAERGLVGTPGALTWLRAVPMTEEDFLAQLQPH